MGNKIDNLPVFNKNSKSQTVSDELPIFKKKGSALAKPSSESSGQQQLLLSNGIENIDNPYKVTITDVSGTPKQQNITEVKPVPHSNRDDIQLQKHLLTLKAAQEHPIFQPNQSEVAQKQFENDNPSVIGMVHLRSGNTDKAKNNFETAIQKNPDDTKALIGLGSIAADKGDNDAAINYYGNAASKNDGTAVFLLAGAQLKKATGKINPLTDNIDLQGNIDLLNESLKNINAVIASNPDDLESHLIKAQALQALGKEDEAKQERKLSVNLFMQNDHGKQPETFEDLAASIGNGLSNIAGTAAAHFLNPPEYLNQIAQGIEGGSKMMDEGVKQKELGGAKNVVAGTLKYLQGTMNAGFSVAMGVFPESGYTIMQSMNAADELTNGEASKIIFAPITATLNAVDAAPTSDIGKSLVGFGDAALTLIAFAKIHKAINGQLGDAKKIQEASDKLEAGESLNGAETKLLYDAVRENKNPITVQKILDATNKISKDASLEVVKKTAPLIATKTEAEEKIQEIQQEKSTLDENFQKAKDEEIKNQEGIIKNANDEIVAILDSKDKVAPQKNEVRELSISADENISDVVGRDAMRNGKVGVIEKDDEGNFIFNDGERQEILPIEDKTNPTETIGQLGLKVAPEKIGQQNISPIVKQGDVNYRNRKYFVSFTNDPVDKVGTKVYEYTKDGNLKSVGKEAKRNEIIQQFTDEQNITTKQVPFEFPQSKTKENVPSSELPNAETNIGQPLTESGDIGTAEITGGDTGIKPTGSGETPQSGNGENETQPTAEEIQAAQEKETGVVTESKGNVSEKKNPKDYTTAAEFVKAHDLKGNDANYRTSVMRGEVEDRRLDVSPDKNYIFKENNIPADSKTVKIYRSSPSDIRAGDFAGLDEKTATLHIRNKNDKIWTKEVPVSDLIQGADATEVIYAPKNEIKTTRQLTEQWNKENVNPDVLSGEGEKKSILNQEEDLRGGTRRDSNNLWKLTKQEIDKWEAEIKSSRLDALKDKLKNLLQIRKSGINWQDNVNVRKRQELRKEIKEIEGGKTIHAQHYVADVRRAIREGYYLQGIEEKRMPANDVKTIIESAGVEVPDEIKKLAHEETESQKSSSNRTPSNDSGTAGGEETNTLSPESKPPISERVDKQNELKGETKKATDDFEANLRAKAEKLKDELRKRSILTPEYLKDADIKGVDFGEKLIDYVVEAIIAAHKAGKDVMEYLKGTDEYKGWTPEQRKLAEESAEKIMGGETTEGSDGVGISIAKLKDQYNFSKDFTSRGGGEVAAGVLTELNKIADLKGIPLNQVIANHVAAMARKGIKLEPTEHNIITAGAHLLNIDKQIKLADEMWQSVGDLLKQRDATAAVLRQLGNNAGRNLGLFNLVFKDVSNSEISVVRDTLKKALGVTDVPESLEELKNSDLTSEDKKRVEPYVRKIEQLKKERDQFEKDAAKNITALNEEEVQKAIKEAHDKGREEGKVLPRSKVAAEKKSKQLRDIASKLRASNELDQFLKPKNPPKESGFVDFGSYKEVVANIFDGLADAVEAGENITEYIKKAIDKIQGDVDRKKLLGDVQMLMSKAILPDKADVVKDITKIATNENAKTITKSMVDKGLIKSIVDDVIHSDVPYDKVIETATDELKQYLPNVTKEDVADAYTKRNAFKEEKKAALENTVKDKTTEVKRLTNKEVRLKALEAGDEYSSAETKEQKQQVRSDFEKSIDDKIKALTDSKKALPEPKSRLQKAKDAVQKRIDAIRKEIAEKERMLKEKELPLHEDVELQRLKEVEKALGGLRDKYLPEAPENFVEENALKKRRVALNKEISDLNDQINAGKRKEKGVKVSDTEHIKTLRKIKEEKQKLLDEIAPDYEKLKKQQERAAKIQAQKIADIDNEIQQVKDSKKVFEQSIKNPKAANEALKAARAARDKTYADNGLRVQKNSKQPIRIEREYQKAITKIENDDRLTDQEKADKKSELKQQRDFDLEGTKQGVISNLSDAIDEFKNDNVKEANDADEETATKLNDLNNQLSDIQDGLKPTGENLEDVANKAYEKINNLIADKDISPEAKTKLQEIKKDFENNNQLTADELAQKNIRKKWEGDIKRANTQIASGTFTDLPTTTYDFKRNIALSNLNRQRQNTTRGLNHLIVAAKEKNRTLSDKLIDLSTKLIVSGVSTAERVGEASVFKPIMDSIVESTVGRVVNKLTNTPRTTFAEIKKGFGTLGAFKNKVAAEKYIAKLQDNKLTALDNLQKAHDSGVKADIVKAEKEFKKADLAYGISTLYHSIDANSLETFWNYLAHNATDLDEHIGKGLKKDIKDYRGALEKTGYVLDGWIRTHAAMKTSLSARNEIMRSFAASLKYFQDNNIPLDEAHLALANDIAINDYEYGRLVNATALSKVFTAGKTSKHAAVRFGTKVVAPVSTVAINLTKRGIDYSSLGAEGWVRLAKGVKEGMRINETEGKMYDTWYQKMRDGINQIPLQERKYINGTISRGLFGAAMMGITYWGLKNGQIKYGGTWDDRNKRKVIGSDGHRLSPDEWEFFGWRAPKLMNSFINHVPEMLPVALTSDVYQISTLDVLNELDETGMAKKHGGSVKDYMQTATEEIESRLPLITLLGLAKGDVAQTLADRFTRVPLAQEGEKLFDKTPREHKTIGEKIKNDAGLNFLNPKTGYTESDLQHPTYKYLSDHNIQKPEPNEVNVKVAYAKEKKKQMSNSEYDAYEKKYNAHTKELWDAIYQNKKVYVQPDGDVTITPQYDNDGNELTKNLNQVTDEELKKLKQAIESSATRAAQNTYKSSQPNSEEERGGGRQQQQPTR